MQAPRNLPVIILLLVAAGAAGFGVYGWLAPGSTPQPTADAMQPGSAPMTPAEALGAKFEDLDDGGSPRALADWHGKALIVNFWATWCAPCRQEIPLLVHVQAQYAAQGLQVVGIATDEIEEKGVKAFLKRMVVNYPMLMGDESVGRLVAGFGGNLIGLPYTLVLDKDGRVLKLHAGELSPAEADGLVRLALGMPPAPTPAPVEEAPADSSTETPSTAK
jgi:thiol-disulfide isomerase/thioredoxin